MNKFLLTALLISGIGVAIGAATDASAKGRARTSKVKAVYHDYSSVLKEIPIDNACITDTEVKTINPIKVCNNLVPIEHKGHGEAQSYTDWVCQSYSVQQLSYKRDFERRYCTKVDSHRGEASTGNCLAWATAPDRMPDEIKISVVHYVNGQGEDDYPGQQGTFKFPACTKDMHILPINGDTKAY